MAWTVKLAYTDRHSMLVGSGHNIILRDFCTNISIYHHCPDHQLPSQSTTMSILTAQHPSYTVLGCRSCQTPGACIERLWTADMIGIDQGGVIRAFPGTGMLRAVEQALVYIVQL